MKHLQNTKVYGRPSDNTQPDRQAFAECVNFISGVNLTDSLRICWPETNCATVFCNFLVVELDIGVFYIIFASQHT